MMMSATCCMVMLLGGLADPDPLGAYDDELLAEPYARLHVGLWGSTDFDFEATRADGERELDRKILAMAGLDAGVVVNDSILLFGTYEYVTGGDLQIDLFGLSAGLRSNLDIDGGPHPPDYFDLYVGVLFGAVDVQERHFGRVADDFGFRLGASLGWEFEDTYILDIFGELRIMEFEYRSDILNGDDVIGGTGIAFGGALTLWF